MDDGISLVPAGAILRIEIWWWREVRGRGKGEGVFRGENANGNSERLEWRLMRRHQYQYEGVKC